MDALAWAVAFILMCVTLGGSAVGCVFLVERGKNKRVVETEKTKRIGMENAWQLEQAKLTALGPGGLSSLTETTFALPVQEGDWR